MTDTQGLTEDSVRQILRNRICPRCKKPFRELSLRKKRQINYLVAIHYEKENKTIVQHYLGVVNDPAILSFFINGEPAIRLSNVLREKGPTLEGWIDILSELEKDITYLVVSKEDKERLLRKLEEIEKIISGR